MLENKDTIFTIYLPKDQVNRIITPLFKIKEQLLSIAFYLGRDSYVCGYDYVDIDQMSFNIAIEVALEELSNYMYEAYQISELYHFNSKIMDGLFDLANIFIMYVFIPHSQYYTLSEREIYTLSLYYHHYYESNGLCTISLDGYDGGFPR